MSTAGTNLSRASDEVSSRPAQCQWNFGVSESHGAEAKSDAAGHSTTTYTILSNNEETAAEAREKVVLLCEQSFLGTRGKRAYF
jgi:hypothetical protein